MRQWVLSFPFQLRFLLASRLSVSNSCDETITTGLMMALLEDEYDGLPQLHCEVLYELLGLVAEELVQDHAMDPEALPQLIR
jgi:hypothetical protein